MTTPPNDKQIQQSFGNYCIALSTGNPGLIKRAFSRLTKASAQRDGGKLSSNAPGNVVRGQRIERDLRNTEGL